MEFGEIVDPSDSDDDSSDSDHPDHGPEGPPQGEALDWSISVRDWRVWTVIILLIAIGCHKWFTRRPYDTLGAHLREADLHWDFIHGRVDFIDIFGQGVVMPEETDDEDHESMKKLVSFNNVLADILDATSPERTAVATTMYFCGAKAAKALWRDYLFPGSSVPEEMSTDQIVSRVLDTDVPGGGVVVCGFILDPKALDKQVVHAFVLHGLPNATYHMYTSVKGQLPLHGYLSAVQRERWLSKAKLRSLMKGMRRLGKGQPVNVVELLGGRLPEDTEGALAKQLEQRRVKVRWAIACELDNKQRFLDAYGADDEEKVGLYSSSLNEAPF